MAESNGSSGILGVIVGVVLVLALGYFFLGERIGLRTSNDIKIETPSVTPTPK